MSLAAFPTAAGEAGLARAPGRLRPPGGTGHRRRFTRLAPLWSGACAARTVPPPDATRATRQEREQAEGLTQLAPRGSPEPYYRFRPLRPRTASGVPGP